MNEPRQLWRFYRLRQRAGKHWNSPLLEQWRECGTVQADDEDTAAARAMAIVGNRGTAIRVEPADEFYRPQSLQ